MLPLATKMRRFTTLKSRKCKGNDESITRGTKRLKADECCRRLWVFKVSERGDNVHRLQSPKKSIASIHRLIWKLVHILHTATVFQNPRRWGSHCGLGLANYKVYVVSCELSVAWMLRALFRVFHARFSFLGGCNLWAFTYMTIDCHVRYLGFCCHVHRVLKFLFSTLLFSPVSVCNQ